MNRFTITFYRSVSLFLFSFLLFPALIYGQDLMQRITENGLLQVIQNDDNIFAVDDHARGVQFKRERDWSIFFDEANRAHARIGGGKVNEAILSESYLYLVPFYRALTDKQFRTEFLNAYPNLDPFSAEEALHVSFAKAKEGIVRIDDPLTQLKLLVEWYETLNQARNFSAAKANALHGDLKAQHDLFVELQPEKDEFIGTVKNVAVTLVDQTKEGQAGLFANHLRAFGLNYGLNGLAWHFRKIERGVQFDNAMYKILADYAIEIARRDDLPFKDRFDALADGAVAVLNSHKERQQTAWRADCIRFINAADELFMNAKADAHTELQTLRVQLWEVFIKENIAPDLWLGEIQKPIDEQEEPKPYKIALQHFKDIAQKALNLLESGELSQDEILQAELVALEAQSWVCQLIQDKGIVFSNDFTFEQAAVERDVLLKIRHRVENNPLQTSKKAFDLIQKARLHEIEYYQYQYKPEPLKQSVALITQYVPEVLPPLSQPVPPPEGRFDIRVGVGMLIWKAMAMDHLQMYDEAESLFNKIIDIYGDRYRYPDPWCFSFVGKARQYLGNIPEKRAELAEQKGGRQ